MRLLDDVGQLVRHRLLVRARATKGNPIADGERLCVERVACIPGGAARIGLNIVEAPPECPLHLGLERHFARRVALDAANDTLQVGSSALAATSTGFTTLHDSVKLPRLLTAGP